MTQSDTRLGSGGHGVRLDEALVGELIDQIREIGVVRFVGRISAGMVAVDEGYEAVERFVALERKRPLISTLGQVLLGRSDSYVQETQF